MADLEQSFRLRAQFDEIDGMIRGLNEAAASTAKLDAALSFTERDIAMMSHGTKLGADAVLKLGDADLKTARAAAGLAKEEHAAGQGAGAAGKESERAAGSIELMERSASKATSTWEMFKGSFLGSLAARGVEELAHLLGSIPGKMIEAAAGTEHLDNALELTFGAAKGKQLADYAGRISHLTFADDDQIKGWILDMGKAGVAFGDLDKNMALAATMAAKSKDPLGAMSMTIDALTEATRRGSISNRQLRPLGIGPEQLKTLDQFKGLTTKQLNKELEQGKVDLSDLRRLLEGNNDLLGTTGVKAAGQMGIALKNLRNAPEQLFQEFAKTKAFEILADQAGKLAAYLAPDGEGGKGILSFFETIESAGVKAWEWLKSDDVAAGIKLIKYGFEGISEALSLTWTIAKGFLGVMYEIFPPVKLVVDAFKAIHDYAKGTVEIEKSNAAIAAKAQNFSRWGESDDVTVARFLKKNGEAAGKAYADGHTIGVDAGSPGAAEAGARLGKGTHEANKDSVKSHSPSLLAMELGMDYAAGWGLGLDNGLSGVRAKIGADDFAIPPRGGPGGGQADGEGGGSPIHITLNTTVHANGGAGEIAHATAEANHEMLASAVAALFSRWRQQAGA